MMKWKKLKVIPISDQLKKSFIPSIIYRSNSLSPLQKWYGLWARKYLMVKTKVIYAGKTVKLLNKWLDETVTIIRIEIYPIEYIKNNLAFNHNNFHKFIFKNHDNKTYILKLAIKSSIQAM